MTPLNNDYWAVKVPKEASEFSIQDGDATFLAFNFDLIRLTEIGEFGRFEIIEGHITKSECTVDAEKIVDKKRIKECWNDQQTDCYVNYMSTEYVGSLCQTAQESLHSLLESKGITLTDSEKVILIRKL